MILDHVSTPKCEYCNGEGVVEGETQAHGVTEWDRCPECDGIPPGTDNLMAVTFRSERVKSLEEEAAGLTWARRELHQAIRDAHQAGHSMRAIAEAAGISHQRVAQLLKKGEGQ